MRLRKRKPRVIGADSPLQEAAILRAWETGNAVIATYDDEGNVVVKEYDVEDRA